MEFTSGKSNSSGTKDNIFIDKATIIGCEITYGEQKSWQSYADDIAVELTLDIGKDFNPTFYMGGNFKVDEVSDKVIGWSTAYKIKIFFEAIGQSLRLTKDANKEAQRLPEEAADYCIDKTFKRLTYKSTKQKPNGDPKWKDWQQTASVDTSNDEFKKTFLNAVTNNWIKDFLSPDDDTPFDSEETEVANAEMPL